MLERPRGAELQQLSVFLCNCAASPPDDERPLSAFDMTGPTQSRFVHPSAANCSLFVPVDATWEDRAPFEASGVLSLDQAVRLQQLQTWLRLMPGFSWIEAQPAVRSAHASFLRIQRRRKSDSSFADKNAIWKFWSCVVAAVFYSYERPMPSLSASDRQVAASAAARLLKFEFGTRMVIDAGLSLQEAKALRQSLEKVKALRDLRRRPRSDATSRDRRFVERLATTFWREFGQVPPAVVIELSGLVVSNPDKAKITKQISDVRRQLAEGALQKLGGAIDTAVGSGK